MKRSGRVVAELAGLCLFLASGATAQQQLHPRRTTRANGGQIVVAQVPRRRLQKPNVRPRAAVAVDPAALELLTKVFHHTLDYVGVQRTQAGAESSEQRIIEDMHGHMRLEYPAPGPFQGDIILTGPNDFYHYHARQNRTDIAYWPTGSKGIKEQAVIRIIRQGLATLAITGQETVTGRDCDILTLSWQRAGAQAETQRRLWVDTVSGIIMRQEHWNANGQISASYMTSITVGPEAGVTPKDFNPALLPRSARQEALFPLGAPPYSTVAQAEVQAGFHILEPAQMPENYTVDGIWVFGRNRNASVLLRYTVGLNHYSLFERPANNLKPAQLNRPYRRSGASLQRWIATLPNGTFLHILYIGHLTPDEVQGIHDSMK